MNNWYTRKEVADLLKVSKATVYHYAKQKKIIKIDDPHRLVREARYEKEGVDALVAKRRQNEPTGMRPSALAKELNVPVQRIYMLIQETDLLVEQLPSGDERMIYSIPKETANWIRQQVEKTASTRGMRVEFYDVRHDIALYQRFKVSNEQEMRVVRNTVGEWGFHLPSGTWIPYADGRDIFQYVPAYEIHQPNEPVKGYTDFAFSRDDEDALLFLDFVYEQWGIENIRVREQDEQVYLSIKSGAKDVTLPLPVTEEKMQSFLILGALVIEDTQLTLVSGYRRTTFDLPTELLEELRQVANEQEITMSEFVEAAVRERLGSEKKDEE